MSDSNSEIFGAKWAARICVILIVGLAAVTGVAFYDAHRLSTMERVEENTAVADKALFIPSPEAVAVKPPGPLLKFKGQTLYPVSFKEYEGRDSRMIRQGMDDSGSYSIYSSTDPIRPFKNEVIPKGAVFYFVKTGPGNYLRLQGTPALK